jgi:hypothetical protein
MNVISGKPAFWLGKVDIPCILKLGSSEIHILVQFRSQFVVENTEDEL